MMTLASQVSSLPVKLVPAHGETLRAVFFLRQAGREGETLGDRLNDPATHFLPAEIKGRTEMVNLSWLAYVEMEAESPEIRHLENLGAQRVKIALRLTTGKSLIGDVLFILPPDRSRISDLLNAGDWRFLLLDLGDRVTYIHKNAIATVRQI